MPVTVVDSGPRVVSRAADVHVDAHTLFEMVADPHRHHELDGSGTVGDTITGPPRLSLGGTFSTKMKQYGVPYRITSRVTQFEDDRLLEWQHPLGHRWRWEFQPQADGITHVVESFDYSRVGPVKGKTLELFGFPKKNGAGIESTLSALQAKFDSPGA